MHGTQVLVQYNHSLVQVFIKKKIACFYNSKRKYSALNFMVFTTELKLLIFEISVRTFLKNLSFRKELKLFATSCKLWL